MKLALVMLVVMLVLSQADRLTYALPLSSAWSTPVLLFQSQAEIRELVPAVDRSGQLHLFWHAAKFPEGSPEFNSELIYYVRQEGEAWTKPVDIVASPYAYLASATVDHQGRAHLLWQESSNQLNYTRASVAEAASARSWSSPVAIEQTYPDAQIVVDSVGRLHRAYPGLEDRGPYYQVSVDGGSTWSFPVNVSATSSSKAAAQWVHLAVGEDSTVHVVWTELQFPTSWPPLGVFYARSTDSGRTWSKPLEVAGYGYDQITVAPCRGNEIHLAWNGMASFNGLTVGGRYHRWSSDGGINWSQPSTITREGFTEGSPQMVCDSDGTLHLLTSSDQRVWYGSWQGGKWNALEYVASGDESGIAPLGQRLDEQRDRHIEYPVMAITRGNKLHVIFWDERPPENRTSVWYTTKDISAPEVPSSGSSTAEPRSTTQPTASPIGGTSAKVSPRRAMPGGDGAGEAMPGNPQATVFTGLWPIAMLVGGVVVWTLLIRDRNR